MHLEKVLATDEQKNNQGEENDKRNMMSKDTDRNFPKLKKDLSPHIRISKAIPERINLFPAATSE